MRHAQTMGVQRPFQAVYCSSEKYVPTHVTCCHKHAAGSEIVRIVQAVHASPPTTVDFSDSAQ